MEVKLVKYCTARLKYMSIYCRLLPKIRRKKKIMLKSVLLLLAYCNPVISFKRRLINITIAP